MHVVMHAVLSNSCSQQPERRFILSGGLAVNAQVVIVDEAHERTVQTDVLLGLLKGVLVSDLAFSVHLVPR